MRRLTGTAISAVLLLASSAAVAARGAAAPQTPPPPPAPKPIDPGRLEDGRYVNDFFGLSFSIPQGWVVHGAAEKQVIMEHGRESVEANADAKRKAAIEASTARSAFLLSISKYPLEQPTTDFNAQFGLLAERIPTAVIKTGSDYFDAMMRVAQGGATKLEPQGPARSERIGGVTFSVMDAKVTSPWGAAAEKLYVTIRDGYAILFYYAYVDEGDVKTFDEIMKSVAFK
jgi:hypothetical protein